VKRLLRLGIHLYRHEVVLFDQAARRWKRTGAQRHQIGQRHHETGFFGNLFGGATSETFRAAIVWFHDARHELGDKQSGRRLWNRRPLWIAAERHRRPQTLPDEYVHRSVDPRVYDNDDRILTIGPNNGIARIRPRRTAVASLVAQNKPADPQKSAFTYFGIRVND